MDQQQFEEHIWEKVGDGRRAIAGGISLGISDIACVDGLTSKATLNIPGGALMLYLEGGLEQFFADRAGGGGTLYVHYHCGYLFVARNLHNWGEHNRVIQDFLREVDRLNEKYGTNFVVIVENSGSAEPYM